MSQAITDALKEAYASAPATKTIIDTIEVHQAGVQPAVYLAQSRLDVVAFDENSVQQTFRASGFQFTLPPANEEGFRSLNIAIDNIGREVSGFINTAKGSVVPVKITYRPYLSDDLSAPQMIPPLVLILKDVEITTLQVTGRATFMDIVNKKFPSELYTRDRFPSLG